MDFFKDKSNLSTFRYNSKSRSNNHNCAIPFTESTAGTPKEVPESSPNGVAPMTVVLRSSFSVHGLSEEGPSSNATATARQRHREEQEGARVTLPPQTVPIKFLRREVCVCASATTPLRSNGNSNFSSTPTYPLSIARCGVDGPQT